MHGVVALGWCCARRWTIFGGILPQKGERGGNPLMSIWTRPCFLLLVRWGNFTSVGVDAVWLNEACARYAKSGASMRGDSRTELESQENIGLEPGSSPSEPARLGPACPWSLIPISACVFKGARREWPDRKHLPSCSWPSLAYWGPHMPS